MDDMTPEQFVAYGLALGLVDSAADTTLQPWEAAKRLQAARAILTNLPSGKIRTILDQLNAAEARALDDTVDYKPTAAELLRAMRALDVMGAPDEVLKDLRLDIKRTDPKSPEYQAASDLLKERNRRRYGTT